MQRDRKGKLENVCLKVLICKKSNIVWCRGDVNGKYRLTQSSGATFLGLCHLLSLSSGAVAWGNWKLNVAVSVASLCRSRLAHVMSAPLLPISSCSRLLHEICSPLKTYSLKRVQSGHHSEKDLQKQTTNKDFKLWSVL